MHIEGTPSCTDGNERLLFNSSPYHQKQTLGTKTSMNHDNNIITIILKAFIIL